MAEPRTLDVVVIADGAVADNMARGEFGVGGDFVYFTHGGAWNVVGEQKRDEVVTFLRGGPFTNHGVDLVNQFEAALMVLVVRVSDQFLAGHQARELMPVGLSEAVNPNFAVGTWIGIAGTCSGMAVAEAADLEAILHDPDGAVDSGHTDVEHRDLDLAAAAGALAFEESGEDAGGEMHPGAGVDESGGNAHARTVAVASHADDARRRPGW